ncbi:MAG TPA: rhomboid family intramembrane serine protease [Chloroflexota bacterium]|nr:rhomboid family intramembrane serine protease [Chloroflexota bacterium]
MPRKATPITWLLLLTNAALFLVELGAGEELEAFLQRWGLVAADISAYLRGVATSNPAVLVTFLSSLFLHAGWLHLLVNLLYLAFFGGAVEGVLGQGRYLALYVFGGVAGGLAHVLARPEAHAPAIGASGAIAGVLAAYLVLLPGAALGSLAPMLCFRPRANVPALLLLFWLLAQALGGVATVASTGGVAWWAHLGGFAGGLALAPLLRPRQRQHW